MMSDENRPNDEPLWWLDHQKNRDKVFYAVVVAFFGFLLADFAYHKHTEFSFEGWFGFFSIYGVVAYLGLVGLATLLGLLLKRSEDYYDE